MRPMFAQVQQQFPPYVLLLISLVAVWTIAWMGVLLWRRSRTGPRFPDHATVNVLFDESWASGNSLKNAFTRLGGANNCLRVTVTDRELWTSAVFPFSALDQTTDLLHRIDRDAITHVEPLERRRLHVAFTRDDGTPGRLVLRLRKRDRFLAAMGVTPDQRPRS